MRRVTLRAAVVVLLLAPAWGTWAAPDGRYTVNETVVRDRVTRLVWERTPAQCAQPDPVTTLIGCDHATATAYCELLVLNGESDWRLPTKYELASLWDYALVDLIGQQLGGRRPASYWSSTPWTFPARGVPWYLVVDTYFGHADALDPAQLWQVRCVRGPADD